MKTLAIIFYLIGCGLLIATCFVSSIALTWWFGGFAIACLALGCIFQFNVKYHEYENMTPPTRHH